MACFGGGFRFPGGADEGKRYFVGGADFAVFFWRKRNGAEAAVFSAVLILCLLPWTVRNYRVYGEIKPFNASAGILYVGNHPGATGELVIDYPMPPGVNPEAMSQIDFDNALGRAGAAFIRENPLEFIKLSFGGLPFISVSRGHSLSGRILKGFGESRPFWRRLFTRF